MPSRRTSPTQRSVSEVDAAIGTLTALVLAIERMPSAPSATDHRTAILRLGRTLAALGGRDMRRAVLQQIGELSPAHAKARRAIITGEWARTSAPIR